jgi:hypothetical protein
MNQFNNKIKGNSFFFFIDLFEDGEAKYLKIDKFFNNHTKLYPNFYFSVFRNSKIDFDFLEKNDNLISFFMYNGKFFFKNQIKNLKACFFYEDKFKNIQNRLNNSFFLNLFYFFRHVYCFIFLLKRLSFIKFIQNKKNN